MHVVDVRQRYEQDAARCQYRGFKAYKDAVMVKRAMEKMGLLCQQ
jgi:hypothetical protein